MSNGSDQRIRHVAIVLQSLDATTSRGLLSQLPTSQSKLVRQAMISLGTVSPQEREAAFHSMQGLLGAASKISSSSSSSSARRDLESSSPAMDLLAAKTSSGLDAIEWSPEVGMPRPNGPDPLSSPIESAPAVVSYRSWESIPLETLADVLANERPIVIATVVNQLSNERAMQVLKMLPMALAGATLAAVPNLHLTDHAILQDIEQELHRKIGATRPRAVENQLGLAKLHAILSSLSDLERVQWQSAVTRSNPVLGSRMGWRDIQGTGVSPQNGQTSTGVQMTMSPSAYKATSATDAPVAATQNANNSHRSEPSTLRAGDDLFEERMVIPIREHIASQENAKSKSGGNSTTSAKQNDAPEQSLRPDLQPLSQLSDRDFVQLIHACSPQTVLLAISGASKAFSSRVERLMPKRDIPRLRARLQSLGPISLRDVDAAQASILDVAEKLAQQGKIASLKTNTGFTIAA